MKQAFTLIELLVVVLIIGILAAIALPQYQKAVLKSRNVQLKTAVVALGQAQEEFLLANGRYSDSFDELSVGVPWPSTTQDPCSLTHTGSDAMRGTDDFYIVLNNASTSGQITAVWKTGEYACTGFAYILSSVTGNNHMLVCLEAVHGVYANKTLGRFCEKIEQLSNPWQGSGWKVWNAN